MTLEEFVPEAFRAATGKLPTFTEGSTKWKNIVASANAYIRRWAREPDVEWNSLYDPAYDIGTVSAADTFDLDKAIRTLSKQEGDSIRIIHAGSTRYTTYQLVDANRLSEKTSGFYVAKIGQTLRFNRAFVSTDPQFGGRIVVPAYTYPRKVVRAKDKIPVDDPDWLVLVVAADYVRNDITRKDLRADLIDEANDCMTSMIQDNEAQSSEVYRGWNPLGHIND